MAKVIEQVIAIKLSRIVKDHDKRESVLDEEQNEDFFAALPQLAETALTDPGVVVEIIKLD